VASTWFLVDSDKVNLKRVRQIIADNQVISVLMMLVFVLFGGGIYLTYKTAIKQVFPFFFAMLWYITCYITYYSIHGIVNRGIRDIKMNQSFLLFLLIGFDLLVFVMWWVYYNDVVGFLMIHLMSLCIKRIQKINNTKIGKLLLIIGLLGWLFGAIALNAVGLKIDLLTDKLQNWNRFYNPFILMIAYGSIILASHKEFYSAKINALSELSLYIYMITGNQLIRMYLDNLLYDLVCKHCGNSMLICIVFVLIYAVVKFLVGIVLSILYKNTVGKFVLKITSKSLLANSG